MNPPGALASYFPLLRSRFAPSFWGRAGNAQIYGGAKKIDASSAPHRLLQQFARFLLWSVGSMPKKQFQHTAHLSSEVEAILQERSKHFPSVNAYLEHCIRLDKAAADQCGSCNYKAMFESVLTTVGIALEDIKKRKQ